MLDQNKWASQGSYADLPARCVSEADQLVLMLRGPCVVEAHAHSGEGFLLPTMRHFALQSENFARIRDDYVCAVVEDGRQTRHKILFIQGFYSQVLIAQKAAMLECSDQWCRWRDTNETLYKAREVAETANEFGVDMAEQWFHGVFL